MRRTRPALALALLAALIAALPAPVAHAAAPVASGAPTISGSTRVGQTLSMSTVTWTASPALTSRGQHWERCDASGDWCSAIAGATSTTYTLDVADEGATVRAVAFASNADGSTFAPSAASAVVAPRQPPVNTVPPAITGTARDGETLSSDTGTWGGLALIGTPTRQWFRCDADGNACAAITGATAASYTLNSTDVGSTIRVQVTARNADGTAQSTSDQTAVVAGTPPHNTAIPTTSGVAREGQTLLMASKGSWRGTSPMGYAYRWERCNPQTAACTAVAGATGTSLLLSAADVGSVMRLAVIATNAIASTTAASVMTAVVAPKAPPSLTAAPAITGTPMDASTLTALDGTWSGTATITFTRRWLRCDALGMSCLPISAAGNKYVLVPEDVGSTLRVQVTARNPDGETVATSDPTPVIEPLPPSSNAAPSVTGTAREGQLLTAVNGTWRGTPTLSYTYRWERCTAADACTAIPGATASTYRLVAADVGLTVRVEVTARNAGGSSSAFSNRTSTITTGPPAVAVLPELSGPVPRDGETWTATDGTWGGTAPIGINRQWLRCSSTGSSCSPISGAIETTYRLTAADVGRTLRLEVTAGNPYGVVKAQSVPSPVVAAAPPVADGTPQISGSTVDGELLTLMGTWSGTPPIALTYQWERCDPLTSACADVPGATAATYRLVSADVGSRLRVRVGASNAGGGGAATSASSAVVAQAPPRVTAAPVLSGKAVELSTLSVGTDQFAGTKPMALVVQWQRCDVRGEACADIAGATESRYALTADDRGSTLRAVVTASNDAGSADAISAASAVVAYAPPVNTIAPAVSPDDGLKDGQVLEATTGAWTGSQPMAYSYQWQRCDERGQTCADIVGAADPTYVLTTADVSRRVRVVVRAANSADAATQPSLATGVVLTNPPVNETPPEISGDTEDGFELVASDGTWSGLVPFTTTYRWWRCDAAGNNCSAIEGATGKRYRQVPADIGLRLRVRVTQANVGGATSATSDASTVVRPSPPRNVVAPQVVGPAAVGRTVTVERGTWAGTPDLTFTYQWRRCSADGLTCEDILGARGEGYRLAPEDDERTVRVVVTAANAQGSATATSATTAEVSDDPPVMVTAPEIEGPELVAHGAVLEATTGAWAGAQPMTYAYRWQRCDAAVNGCTDITGATGSAYALGLADVNKRIRVVVTAQNVVDMTPATSAATGLVKPEPPANVAAPRLTAAGAVRDGVKLTASVGTWTGAAPIAYAITWVRCAADGTSCGLIPDAIGTSYTLADADVGRRVRARVTARNAATEAVADSDLTDVVAAAPPVNDTRPAAIVIDGRARVGGRVRAVAGTFSGTAPIAVGVQWQRCLAASTVVCDDIPGATGAEYELSDADVGRRVRIVATGRNSAGAVSADSLPTEVVPAVAPENLAPPTVDGTPVEGGQLRAGPGGWAGSTPIAYAYAWERCPQPSAPTCAKIANAAGPTYTLTTADVGKFVRVNVTAANAGGKAAQVSAVTGFVAGQPPRNVDAPSAVAKRSLRVGVPLTSTPGRWTGTAPLKHEYQWQRCNPRGLQCVDVPGAEKATYALKADDLQGTALRSPMRIVVTTTNLAGRGEAASTAVGVAGTAGGPDAATAGEDGAGRGRRKARRRVARSKSSAAVRRFALTADGRLLVSVVCARKARSSCGAVGSFAAGGLRQRLSVNGLGRGRSVTRRYRLTGAQRRTLRGKARVTFVLRLAAPATPTFAKVRRVRVAVPKALSGKVARRRAARRRTPARRPAGARR